MVWMIHDGGETGGKEFRAGTGWGGNGPGDRRKGNIITDPRRIFGNLVSINIEILRLLMVNWLWDS